MPYPTASSTMGGAITGRIDEAIEQNIRNRCFRCPECQRQARAVGRRVADFQRPVRFRFHAQARRVRPAVASLEVPLDNRALLRRWRGFRTIGGAPCIAALLDVCFPVDWLSHSQGSRSSNKPRLSRGTNLSPSSAIAPSPARVEFFSTGLFSSAPSDPSARFASIFDDIFSDVPDIPDVSSSPHI